MKHILRPTFVALLFINCAQAAEVPFIELGKPTERIGAAVLSPDGKKIVVVSSEDISASERWAGKEWLQQVGTAPLAFGT